MFNLVVQSAGPFVIHTHTFCCVVFLFFFVFCGRIRAIVQPKSATLERRGERREHTSPIASVFFSRFSAAFSRFVQTHQINCCSSRKLSCKKSKIPLEKYISLNEASCFSSAAGTPFRRLPNILWHELRTNNLTEEGGLNESPRLFDPMKVKLAIHDHLGALLYQLWRRHFKDPR